MKARVDKKRRKHQPQLQVSKMVKLPIDLTAHILSRLPAKSVVRSSCVSTEFASLLSQPYFATLHCRHNQQNLKLLSRFGLLFSLNLDSLDFALRLNFLPQYSVKKVLGCSNAMLCFSVTDKYFPKSQEIDDIVVICNLSTGARHTVPPSPIELHPKELSMVEPCAMMTRSSYAFGFEPWTNDHKLVMICQCKFGTDRHGRDYYILSEIKVYSINTNSWSTVFQDASWFFIATTEPVLVDGVLYWVAGTTDCSLGYDSNTLLVASDLADGVFREVASPDGKLLCFYCLGVLRGKLCAMCWDSGVKFWSMEVYGDVVSWTVLASFANCDYDFLFPRNFVYHKSLAFSKNGDRILVDKDAEEFICCDLATVTGVTCHLNFISMQ